MSVEAQRGIFPPFKETDGGPVADVSEVQSLDEHRLDWSSRSVRTSSLEERVVRLAGEHMGVLQLVPVP